MEAWIESLPRPVREPVLAFADPHPHGARARAMYAGTALAELAAGWPPGRDGLLAALADLAAHLRSVGQGTAHQPGVNNMIAFMLAAAAPVPAVQVAEALRSRLETARESFATASDTMAKVGADLLCDGSTVLVHDFADRSTQAVITLAGAQGKRLHVVATACRSRRADGLRVAREAVQAGHRATVVTDAGIGWVMGHYGLHAAFIGADGILADGTLLTTPGALTVAMVGQNEGVPVYAVTDLWKLMDALSPEIQRINEAPDPDGVPESADWAAAGFGFLNPLVDIVPGKYLTSYVTEAGLLTPASVGATARALYETSPATVDESGRA